MSEIQSLFSETGPNPQVLLRDVADKYPRAKTIVCVIMDEDGTAYVRNSSISIERLAFCSKVLSHFVNRVFNGRMK